MNTPKKFAVLIDADNTSHKTIGAVLQEIAKYGIAIVKRVYGDWSSEINENGKLTNRLYLWRDASLSHAITPIQQFAYTKGKDATDMMLIINAMDLLYGNHLDGFCIVSSDSDFTPLALRIRESGLIVYGFGQEKTPKAFINACDKFIYIENLLNDKLETTPPKDKPTANHHSVSQIPLAQSTTQKTDSNPETPTNNQPKPIDEPILQLIYKAIKDTADDDGWSNLSVLGNHLTIIKPDFDTRTYGRAKLSGLLKLLDVFEIKQEGSQKYVRKRPSFGKFLNIVHKTIKQYKGINEWAYLNPLAIEIKKQHPDFDTSEYGCRNIVELIKKIESKSFEFTPNKTQIRLVPPKETHETA